MSELTGDSHDSDIASHGGPKTPDGKRISRYNALKHGILSNVLTDYDEISVGEWHAVLKNELEPGTLLEEVLVERIAYILLRLSRVAKAETEHVKKCLNPTITEPYLPDLLEGRVLKKGYEPRLSAEHIEPLFSVYYRYEKSLENRLYRALLELDKIQNARKRSQQTNSIVAKTPEEQCNFPK
jgi:uncharacterized iron-regulated protein